MIYNKIYIKQRIKLNHNIIYTTTCDVLIIDYLINHRSKSLSDAIIIYLLLMKSQPIHNTIVSASSLNFLS